jgi:hypothetical protein
VYQVLRGKDVDTGLLSPQRREKQFEKLREAQAKVLNLTSWHQFFNALVGAGFRSGELVSSEIALLYTYVFYLIGRTQCGVPLHTLDKLIGRWFYASTLRGRYTGSSETVMDDDLSRVKDLAGAGAFEATLDRIIIDTLTSDFWTITLPNSLETSSSRSPALFAYYAAQNKLGAPVLFSNKRIFELLDPMVSLKKKALDRHHLFPRAWLESQGITDVKLVNQIANMALVEWPDDMDISDTPPAVYVPKMRSRFSADAWDEMCRFHGLPENWEKLPYEEFLVRRRKLMAEVIRAGYQMLAQ